MISRQFAILSVSVWVVLLGGLVFAQGALQEEVHTQRARKLHDMLTGAHAQDPSSGGTLFDSSHNHSAHMGKEHDEDHSHDDEGHHNVQQPSHLGPVTVIITDVFEIVRTGHGENAVISEETDPLISASWVVNRGGWAIGPEWPHSFFTAFQKGGGADAQGLYVREYDYTDHCHGPGCKEKDKIEIAIRYWRGEAIGGQRVTLRINDWVPDRGETEQYAMGYQILNPEPPRADDSEVTIGYIIRTQLRRL